MYSITIRVIFTAFSLSLVLAVFGQPINEQAKFTRIGLKEGLSQSSVFSLYQDYLGFMWIGTRDGLNRYDAQKFVTYRNTPSDSNSLSDNYIMSLLEDSKKRLWIGTSAGINLYDRQQDHFIRIPLADNQSGNYLSEPMVSAIVEDQQGRVWFGTNQGLFCWDEQRDANHLVLVFDAAVYSDLGVPLGSNNVQSVHHDQKGNVWLGTVNGVIVLEPYSSELPLRLLHHFRHRPGELNAEDVRCILEVKAGIFWFGTKDGGINVYNSSTHTFEQLLHQANANGRSLANNDVRSIIADRFGGIWIGTINGLNYYTEENGFVTHSANDYDQFSLSNNSIRPIFQDTRGSVWIGTYYGGVCVYDRHVPVFQNYAHSPYVSSLSYNIVSGILEDEHQNLWVSTEGGGLNYFDRSRQVFSHFKHDPSNPGSLSHNHVKSMLLDRRGNLWAGTYTGGLNLLKKNSRAFQHIKHDPDVPNSISNNNVYAIKEDRQGNIWFGTYGGGLNFKKDGLDNYFEIYRVGKTGRYHLSSDLVRTIYIDSQNNLWVGTEDGLNLKRNGTDHFEVFRFSLDDPNSISGNIIISIFEDSKNRIWFGTFKNGLNQYHHANNSFSQYTEQDGLPGNNIFGILEDKGQLWLSTNNGICSFEPESNTFKSYNTKDGIAGNEFAIGAYCKTTDGQLIFGASHGLTCFNPRDFSASTYVPPIVFTDLKLFNQSVAPGDGSVLEKPLSITDTIVLNHAQNIFTVEFAAINYVLPEKNQYAYKLQGLEESWNYVNVPFATYTNLDAGTYTLLVKGSSNDGIWNEIPTMLTIKILPPLWKTWWAYTIYAILIATGIYIMIRFTRIRSRLEHELELEHLEKERQQEINEFKLNFFTSISHEFRTPLTLILAPIQNILAHAKLEENTKGMMKTVKNNSLRLLNLVNQLLDFRKQESGNFQLEITQHDLAGFIENIGEAFKLFAKEKNINFEFSRPTQRIPAWFDHDQLEKIFYNLLSNAFKFTPANGNIKLKIFVHEPNKQYPHGFATICVWDNGIGIPQDKLALIFEFFYQLNTQHEENKRHFGSGIGLALAKNITEMHGGKLTVESNQNADTAATHTCFSVELPLGNSHVTPEQLLTPADELPVNTLLRQSLLQELPQTQTVPVNNVDAENGENRQPLILLVEDNTDIRSMIEGHLKKKYVILQASNGLEGWDMAKAHLPDLVVSDIMMPVQDGISLLKNIKDNLDTNHIPVLLVTARTSIDNVLEGLHTGGDDYITKPFHLDVLTLKIHNILASRERFRKKFIRDYVLTPQQVSKEIAPDKQFLQKTILLIEKNLAETEFNVNTLASDLGMSRPVLYRKLKQMTDMSVIELINVLRLRKAAQLLTENDLPISEVAYRVGFSDPKYFGKSFKAYFGKSPKQYASMKSDGLHGKTTSIDVDELLEALKKQ